MNPLSFTLVSLAYLAGTIPFGVIIARQYGVNIRREGSKNIGATNVGRVITEKFGEREGKKAKNKVMAGDAAKGLVPVLAALLLRQNPAVVSYVAGAALLGHCFPFYSPIKGGGKGVATGLGISIAILNVWAAIPVVVYYGVKKITRYVSVASICGVGMAAVMAQLLITTSEYKTFFVFSFVLILFTHRANLWRLAKGTENRVPRKG